MSRILYHQHVDKHLLSFRPFPSPSFLPPYFNVKVSFFPYRFRYRRFLYNSHSTIVTNVHSQYISYSVLTGTLRKDYRVSLKKDDMIRCLG